jgi:hypothetical protein
MRSWFVDPVITPETFKLAKFCVLLNFILLEGKKMINNIMIPFLPEVPQPILKGRHAAS